MALSALRACLGVGASRMIVNSVRGAAGRTTGNASSFSRNLKVVGDNVNTGGFSKIRRFSDVAGIPLPEQLTANTRFGEYCFSLYLGLILGTSGILWGLGHIVSERRERIERRRFPRYDDDIKHEDVLQFGHKYVDAMDSQDQLVSQWPPADDGKLAQLKAEVAELCGAVGRFDLRADIAELDEELLRAGTTDEALEIRKRRDGLVEDMNLMVSQWRTAAHVNMTEFKTQIMEMRQEIQRKQNGL